MKISIKHSSYIYAFPLTLYLIVASHVSYAIQPLSEIHLAESVGEQSPIDFSKVSQIVNQTPDSKEILSNELNEIDRYIKNYQHQQYHLALSDLLEKKQHIFLNLDRLFEYKAHEVSIGHLGLEPFSKFWNGNVEDILDINQNNQIYYDRVTAKYELNNVQGHVQINVNIY